MVYKHVLIKHSKNFNFVPLTQSNWVKCGWDYTISNSVFLGLPTWLTLFSSSTHRCDLFEKSTKYFVKNLWSTRWTSVGSRWRQFCCEAQLRRHKLHCLQLFSMTLGKISNRSRSKKSGAANSTPVWTVICGGII